MDREVDGHPWAGVLSRCPERLGSPGRVDKSLAVALAGFAPASVTVRRGGRNPVLGGQVARGIAMPTGYRTSP